MRIALLTGEATPTTCRETDVPHRPLKELCHIMSLMFACQSSSHFSTAVSSSTHQVLLLSPYWSFSNRRLDKAVSILVTQDRKWLEITLQMFLYTEWPDYGLSIKSMCASPCTARAVLFISYSLKQEPFKGKKRGLADAGFCSFVCKAVSKYWSLIK